MSFNWFEFLTVSEELLKFDEESYLRSSISRSYYGIFGAVRKMVEVKRTEPFSRRHVHAELIYHLTNHLDRRYRAIGLKMDVIRRERIKADYIGTVTINKPLAKKVYDWAKQLQALLLAQLL